MALPHNNARAEKFTSLATAPRDLFVPPPLITKKGVVQGRTPFRNRIQRLSIYAQMNRFLPGLGRWLLNITTPPSSLNFQKPPPILNNVPNFCCWFFDAVESLCHPEVSGSGTLRTLGGAGTDSVRHWLTDVEEHPNFRKPHSCLPLRSVYLSANLMGPNLEYAMCVCVCPIVGWRWRLWFLYEGKDPLIRNLFARQTFAEIMSIHYGRVCLENRFWA